MSAESIRLYKLMNVDRSTLYYDKSNNKCLLVTQKAVFDTNYVSHIPVDITEDEFNSILLNEGDTYKGKRQTPIIHKVRELSIKYLRDTNKLKKD